MKQQAAVNTNLMKHVVGKKKKDNFPQESAETKLNLKNTQI